MKRIQAFLSLLLCLTPLFAQQRTVERVYVTTDRDAYVAGEQIGCSAFCVDVRGGLSTVSRVAYLELHSADGLAASARLALEQGRGAGTIALPASLPTGNYRLIAYTAQNRAEIGYDYEGIASKTISVFNALTTDRVADGVEVLTPEAYAALAEERSPIRSGMTIGVMPGSDRNVMPGSDRNVMPGSDRASVALEWHDGALTLVNHGNAPASLSLSVYHDDGIAANANPDIAAFIAAARKTGTPAFDNNVLPDYEGEVLYGHIVGFSQEMIPELIGKYAFISSPSDKSDVYAAPIRDDGSLVFFTGNIYGDKECICEIEGIDPKFIGHVELRSPYANPSIAAAPKLPISASLADALKLRSVGMQLQRRFAADSLLDFLPRRPDALFDESIVVRYVLDDYTRFTTMEEVFVEFIPEIRVRRRDDGSTDIKVRLEDASSSSVFSTGKTLMLLDGVPVFDQQKIMDYDPLLVESIDIYPRTHIIGNRVFEGLVNFVTYKRNLPSFKFDGNARVIDWQGICLPVAFTGAAIAESRDYPDYRQTIYWHPLLRLEPGESRVIEFPLPRYDGRFSAVAEGLTTAGEPVRGCISFENP